MIKEKQKILDKISRIEIDIWYKELEKRKYMLELNKFQEDTNTKIWFKVHD
jgi:hypothetical protein